MSPIPRGLTLALIAVVTVFPPEAAGSDSPITAQQAATHGMRYHLALPHGWTADRPWPVLVVIPDAHRDFAANLARFVSARGQRPYILVAPEVLSCGGARTRTRDRYAYNAAEWSALQDGDDFAFEDAGLGAVLADVAKKWHGEPRAFLTGWEAGGHTVWAQTFRHPERWRGVAPVTTNYQQRGVTASSFSRDAARAALAVQPLFCGVATGDAAEARAFCEKQTAHALADAREHGFAPNSVRVVAGAEHGPLPEAVLAWCDSLRGDR